ncbi:hypothetical protein ARMSODRAFT_972130 [Armillaria solidipes]|uniref:Uncharacterized protein n=1 Tax=Armillaria solidipes TaxID=1076256 RepID=A0A2H3CAC8_9AGAR|nr:hypothetical protein ARMSODRAFT_972130 [Armillaria solidipes]
MAWITSPLLQPLSIISTHFSMKTKARLTGEQVHSSIHHSTVTLAALESEHPAMENLYPSIAELSLGSFLNPDYIPSAEVLEGIEEKETITHAEQPLGLPLHRIELLSFMSKVSAYEFYHTLVCLTDHSGMHAPPVILEEEKSTCNNHDAVKLTNSRGGQGAMATGVGAVLEISRKVKDILILYYFIQIERHTSWRPRSSMKNYCWSCIMGGSFKLILHPITSPKPKIFLNQV